MTDEHAPPDFARMNGWDAPYPVYERPEVPAYTGVTLSYCNRPLIESDDELMSRRARRGDRRRSIRRGRLVPARSPFRAARHSPGDVHPGRPLAAARRSAVRGARCRRCRGRERRSGSARARPRDDLSQGARSRAKPARYRSFSAAITRSPGRRPARSRQFARRAASASSISTHTPTPRIAIGECSPDTARRCDG